MKSRAWIGWVCLGLSGLLAWPSLGFYVAPAGHRPRVRRLPAGGSETNNCHGLPEHLALILDGNGRWAENRGLPRTLGHHEGAKRAIEVMDLCREVGIKVVTMYCLSTENWTRPSEEVDVILRVIQHVILKKLDYAHQHKIRLVSIGQRWRLPPSLCSLVERVEGETQGYSGMTLCLALSYGGRDEVLRATQSLAQKAKEGELDPDSISEDMLYAHMDSGRKGLPPPDLLIRTSGERRLSNFMLLQLAYSEIVFTNTLWPDFGRADLLACLDDYTTRSRRYGGLTRPPQVQLQVEAAPPGSAHQPPPPLPPS